MTKEDILEAISHISGEDQRVVVVYIDPDGEGDAEEGDILTLDNTGYEPRLGHVLRFKKA